MSLRRDLRKTMQARVTDLRVQATQLRILAAVTEKAIGSLSKLNLAKAKYLVKLDSLWANEGEKSIERDYSGPLEDAIITAEKEFKELNRRGDVQARYFVRVYVGEALIEVPKEYVEMYRERGH